VATSVSTQYDVLARFANDAILVVDMQHRLIEVNEGAVRLYGYEREELLRKRLDDLSRDKGDKAIAAHFAAIAAEGAARFETRHVRKDGSVFTVEASARRVETAEGDLIVTVLRDVTAARAEAEDLRSSREYLEKLIDYASVPMILWDPGLRVTRFNPAFERMTARSASEVVGQDLSMLFPDESKRQAIAQIRQTAEGERLESVEIPILHADGRRVTVLWNSANIFAKDGTTLVATIAQGVDITERKAAEEDLRSSRDYVEQLFDYASAPIIVWDSDGIITRFNFGFERLTGRLSADLVGQPLGTLFPDEARESFLALIGQTLEEESRGIVEIPILHADGSQLVVLWNSSNIFAKDGTTLLATIAQGVDITERKAAEGVLLKRTEDLARSNAELEQFAYIASHDLQEPLRMVASYTQLLKKRYAGKLDADADDFIDYAVGGATRMQTLINELLAFSRVGTQGGRFAMTSLEGLMQRIARSLETRIDEAGATLVWDGLPEVVCDGGQIERVLQNLVVNALKFHGDRPSEVTVSAERGDGEWLLRVTDNGIGIEEEYKERVFVIFQRLNARTEFEGTGMGLAICKRIVERHGGRVWVESVPGEGSSFYFTIPDLEASDS
jgi:PAS domain S-box-containing protein